MEVLIFRCGFAATTRAQTGRLRGCPQSPTGRRATEEQLPQRLVAATLQSNTKCYSCICTFLASLVFDFFDTLMYYIMCTAALCAARNPYLYPAGEKGGGIFTNVYYNSDVNVDIYNQNPTWGKSVAQLTAETALSDLGFDTEKWSKNTNTAEYLYYPDLKYFENDNPAYSASTPVPTGLTASAGYDSITLTWNEFSGATMYAVYYSTDDSRYKLVSDAVTETNYTLTELESGKKYYFKISAYVSEEWTGCSNTIDVDTDSYYVRAHSLTLGDDIGVKFYIEFADNVLADESSYIKFTVNGRESTLYVKDVNCDSYYGYEFICPFAAAQQKITARFNHYCLLKQSE